MDDIEEQFSHVDFVSLAADRAAYKMADSIDTDVLSVHVRYTDSRCNTTTVSGTAQHPTSGDLNW